MNSVEQLAFNYYQRKGWKLAFEGRPTDFYLTRENERRVVEVKLATGTDSLSATQIAGLKTFSPDSYVAIVICGGNRCGHTGTETRFKGDGVCSNCEVYEVNYLDAKEEFKAAKSWGNFKLASTIRRIFKLRVSPPRKYNSILQQ